MKRFFASTFSGFVCCLVFARVGVAAPTPTPTPPRYLCPNGVSYVTNCAGITNASHTVCIVTLPGSGCCAPGTCLNGACNAAATQTACNDGNVCTNDDCTTRGGGDPAHQWDPLCSVISYQPDGTVCDADANQCTLDFCHGGACLYSGSNLLCTPGQCQVASCLPATGCHYDPMPNNPPVACDDGNDCTTGEHCVSGTCMDGVKHPGAQCLNGQPCNQGTCSATGVCQNRTPLPNGTLCDPDGNKCKVNLCNSGTCVYQYPLNCLDGLDCTVGETCDPATGCKPPTGVQPAGTACWEGNRCHPGTCNGIDGTCSNRTYLPLGAHCDTNPCTDDACVLINGQEYCHINGCIAGAVCTTCGGGSCGTSIDQVAGYPCLCQDVLP